MFPLQKYDITQITKEVNGITATKVAILQSLKL